MKLCPHMLLSGHSVSAADKNFVQPSATQTKVERFNMADLFVDVSQLCEANKWSEAKSPHLERQKSG